MFGSDSPVLPMARYLGETAELELRPDVLDKYLYANEQRFFFPEKPSPTLA